MEKYFLSLPEKKITYNLEGDYKELTKWTWRKRRGTDWSREREETADRQIC